MAETYIKIYLFLFRQYLCLSYPYVAILDDLCMGLYVCVYPTSVAALLTGHTLFSFIHVNRNICIFYRCPQSYIGTYCELDNPCGPSLDLCMNDGTCTVIQAGGIKARCDCKLGRYY